MAKYGKKARLLSMLTLTGLFFLAEIITGYLTNSMALVADSFHMLSDVLSILIAFVAVHYSGKKSKTNTYDWARAEVLGAMANAVFLMALVFTIIVAAIQRLVIIEPITQPLLVLGVGAAGLVINIIGLAIFGQHAHGHSHDHGDGSRGHSHEKHHGTVDPPMDDIITITPPETGSSENESDATKDHSGGHMNMQAVFLHVLGDALGSIVVIISALIIHFVQDDWRYYIDPVMSLVMSLIISCTTIPLLRRASMILLQNPPQTIDIDAVKEKVAEVPGVLSIHDLHVWQLSSSCVIATVHVIIRNGCDFTDIAKELKKIFHEVDIHATTIQPEYLYCKDPSRQSSLETANSGEFDLSLCECRPQSRGSDGEIHACGLHVVPRQLTEDTRFTEDTSSDEDSDVACLLSCMSDDCLPHMCCEGVRRRAGSKANDFVNQAYTDTEYKGRESIA